MDNMQNNPETPQPEGQPPPEGPKYDTSQALYALVASLGGKVVMPEAIIAKVKELKPQMEVFYNEELKAFQFVADMPAIKGSFIEKKQEQKGIICLPRAVRRRMRGILAGSRS